MFAKLNLNRLCMFLRQLAVVLFIRNERVMGIIIDAYSQYNICYPIQVWINLFVLEKII
jgi:hypothetical protein